MKHGISKGSQAHNLDISRSNLYYQSKQEKKDWATKMMIEEGLRKHPSYGHKRMATHLKINKKRVRRVMKKYGIKPYRRRGKKGPRKATGVADYPNLLLTTTPNYPNHIWASDFTYLWFEDRWYYVATILDVYTRQIVGIDISDKHDRFMVTRALLDALRNNPHPEILHSDHGSEYCSHYYQEIVSRVGIKSSMAGRGCPWENGYQESFYSQFKVDLGDPNRFETLGELTVEIYQRIYYYNNERLHSSLKNMAPSAFARQYGMMSSVLELVS
jgi:putative transposase